MDNKTCTHYWVIDSDNVGRCKYCPEVRDFGSLRRMAGVFVAAGRRGAEALGEKRGRKRRSRMYMEGER